MSYSRFSQAKYLLSNGVDIYEYNSDSAVGELGSRLTVDTHINDTKISPFINVGVSREFVENNKVALNNKVFSSGNESVTGKYQMGAKVALTPDTILSASLSYRHGDKMESPVSAYIGLKVSFFYLYTKFCHTFFGMAF